MSLNWRKYLMKGLQEKEQGAQILIKTVSFELKLRILTVLTADFQKLNK